MGESPLQPASEERLAWVLTLATIWQRMEATAAKAALQEMGAADLEPVDLPQADWSTKATAWLSAILK
jgi:hypothetical protein